MSPQYAAAHDSAVLFGSRGRHAFRISGREPARMLTGITTGSVPATPAARPWGHRGQWAYSTILTPKGRMVSDLRLTALPGDLEAFLMDLPEAGVEAVMAHLKLVLPPRMARAEPADLTLTTVVGAEAANRLAEPLGIPSEVLEDLAEGDAVFADSGAAVLRAQDAVAPVFDLWCPALLADSIRSTLVGSGVTEADEELWEVLRVEAGRPEFGKDMSQDTIPNEAGIENRAIDHTKGCYTGQEVIVRIRDRGHVNRHLRGLLPETGERPATGDELFREGQDRAIGWVTSVVESPAAGGPVALGYVRREVEPGGRVLIGSPTGPSASVRDLANSGWVTSAVV